MPYRRSYERFILNDSVSLVTQEGIEKTLALKDLSARGAGILGDFPLDINQRVTLAMKSSFILDKPVAKQAKVVWCKKIDNNLWQAGLDFGLDNKINFI